MNLSSPSRSIAHFPRAIAHFLGAACQFRQAFAEIRWSDPPVWTCNRSVSSSNRTLSRYSVPLSWVFRSLSAVSRTAFHGQSLTNCAPSERNLRQFDPSRGLPCNLHRLRSPIPPHPREFPANLVPGASQQEPLNVSHETAFQPRSRRNFQDLKAGRPGTVRRCPGPAPAHRIFR